MRLLHLRASHVHGHLAFDISFRQDYTFLIGLNGSGKTSALRLIMALLAPDIKELAAIPFGDVRIDILDDGIEKRISAIRSSETLTVHVQEVQESLVLTAVELQLLEEPRPPDTPISPVLQKVEEHPVYKYLIGRATPMFLGVDRRFAGVGPKFQNTDESRRKEFLIRRTLHDEAAIRRGNVAAGLADVNILVYDTFNEIRQRQEKLDTDFRNKLLTSAFDYKPSEADKIGVPSQESINQYKSLQNEIETALENLQIPLQDVKEALDKFFSRMNVIVKGFETSMRSRVRVRHNERSSGGKRPRTYGATEPPRDIEPPGPEVIEWFVNKTQVDRIFAHLELLKQYSSERSSLREPIEKFLSLLNSFLCDTNKQVFVSVRGSLKVQLGNSELSVGALSSGERQLLVMLGHLALNKQLEGSAVFMVDEPELSLHISWQERFVDAIRQANPSVQVVLATHSPAIILERDEHCELVSAG